MRKMMASVVGALMVGSFGCTAEPDAGEAYYAVACEPGAACDCPGQLTAGTQVCAPGQTQMICECLVGDAAGAGPTGVTAMSTPVAPPVQAAPVMPPEPEPVEPAAPEPGPEPAQPTESPELPQAAPEATGPTEDPDPMANDGANEEPMAMEDVSEEEDPEDPVGEPADGAEVPDNENCADASTWDTEWSEFEQRVLELTNENRAAGAVCGGMQMDSVGPLTMSPELRCAARLHSKDMAEQMYFDHRSQDGRDPGQRIAATGYRAGTWGENIAWGQTSPEQVVGGWMDSPGHCTNIMRGSFTQIGIGLFAGESSGSRWGARPYYWTQAFGTPRGAGGWRR